MKRDEQEEVWTKHDQIKLLQNILNVCFRMISLERYGNILCSASFKPTTVGGTSVPEQDNSMAFADFAGPFKSFGLWHSFQTIHEVQHQTTKPKVWHAWCSTASSKKRDRSFVGALLEQTATECADWQSHSLENLGTALGALKSSKISGCCFFDWTWKVTSDH